MKGMPLEFVGSSYQAPDLLQSAEDSINFYIEKAQVSTAKEPNALLGCPGLAAVVSSMGTGPVRGCWVLPGGQQALVVVASSLYCVTITVQATANTIPVYTAVYIGALLTNSGPVVMRDNGVLQNGVGGYCLIVDGTYGYYYLLSGTQYINTFQGTLTAGYESDRIAGVIAERPYCGLDSDAIGCIWDNSHWNNHNVYRYDWVDNHHVGHDRQGEHRTDTADLFNDTRIRSDY